MAYEMAMIVYAFRDCELDDQNYVLRRAGTAIKVEPKVFEVLTYLFHYRDRFVSREELFTQLWPDNVVSDAALLSVRSLSGHLSFSKAI
jgi:DNA-binding winged helix-turn-helix (wHTH) protein